MRRSHELLVLEIARQAEQRRQSLLEAEYRLTEEEKRSFQKELSAKRAKLILM